MKYLSLFLCTFCSCILPQRAVFPQPEQAIPVSYWADPQFDQVVVDEAGLMMASVGYKFKRAPSEAQAQVKITSRQSCPLPTWIAATGHCGSIYWCNGGDFTPTYVAHEFAHALGVAHLEDGFGVMNATANDAPYFTAADLTMFEKRKLNRGASIFARDCPVSTVP